MMLYYAPEFYLGKIDWVKWGGENGFFHSPNKLPSGENGKKWGKQ